MLLILFMAFCFIAESLLLVIFCRTTGNKLVQALREPEAHLLEQFRTEFMLVIDNERRHHGGKELYLLLSDPHMRKQLNDTQFWTKVEVKIFEELFICAHGLPKEFDYGYYISNLFIKYITNVGGVSALAWFTLAVFVILNYFKTQLDGDAESTQCSGGGSDDFHNKSNNDVHCYQFLFTYFLFCGVLLNVATLITYLMSVRYTRALLRKGMTEVYYIEGQNQQDGQFLSAAKPCCNIFGSTYNERIFNQENAVEMDFWQLSYERLGWGVSTFTQQQYIWCIQRLYEWRKEEETLNKIQSRNSKSHSARNSHIKLSRTHSMQKNNGGAHVHQKTSLERLLMHMNSEHGKLIHKKELQKQQNGIFNSLYNKKKVSKLDNDSFTSPRIQDPRRGGPNYDIEDNEKINMDSLFLFNRPKLFFIMIDILCLLNTFYSAFYLTQILPMCVFQQTIGWGILLGLPMVFGFSWLRFTLLRSVLLQAVSTFDVDMAGQVIEDTIESINIADDIQIKILNKFFNYNANMTVEQKLLVINHCFDSIDEDKSGEVDKYEFREFLGSMEIYLTNEKFKLLWRKIDLDNNGTISKDEILVYLFPELKSLLKDELKIIRRIRERVNIMQWDDDYLKDELFDQYDKDGSGTIELGEFKEMITGPRFGFHNISNNQFKLVFAAIDTDQGGNLSWEEFLAICRPDPRNNTNFSRSTNNRRPFQSSNKSHQKAGYNSKKYSVSAANENGGFDAPNYDDDEAQDDPSVRSYGAFHPPTMSQQKRKNTTTTTSGNVYNTQNIVEDADVWHQEAFEEERSMYSARKSFQPQNCHHSHQQQEQEEMQLDQHYHQQEQYADEEEPVYHQEHEQEVYQQENQEVYQQENQYQNQYHEQNDYNDQYYSSDQQYQQPAADSWQQQQEEEQYQYQYQQEEEAPVQQAPPSPPPPVVKKSLLSLPAPRKKKF